MLHSYQKNNPGQQRRLEDKVKKIITPLQAFINSQTAASLLLGICTLIAIIWSSIPSISATYRKFLSLPIGFHIASLGITKPLKYWASDILLTLFFFLIGLEIKREILVGELTNFKKSSFIILSAIGGMIFPALIYFIVNAGTQYQSGWGIPMATDTAFALGLLYCFRKKLPKGVFSFIAALAIIDDIGAVIVIAIFYTDHMNFFMMCLSLLILATLVLFNCLGFRRPWPYVVFGLLLMTAIQWAGLHGTIAGILVALVVPARPEQAPKQFIEQTKDLLSAFEQRKEKSSRILEDKAQHEALEEVQAVARKSTTPLQRWETKLEVPISTFILPLFALVNAGIPLQSDVVINIFTNRVSLGIMLGLVIGKPLGVLLFGKIAIMSKVGKMPTGTTAKHIICAAILTGIGFTVSLFIADLSFVNQEIFLLAKTAILAGSLIAAIIGVAFLLVIS